MERGGIEARNRKGPRPLRDEGPLRFTYHAAALRSIQA